MCDELKCKEDGHYLHSVQSVVIISSCVEKLIYGGNALPTTQDDIVRGEKTNYWSGFKQSLQEQEEIEEL